MVSWNGVTRQFSLFSSTASLYPTLLPFHPFFSIYHSVPVSLSATLPRYFYLLQLAPSLWGVSFPFYFHYFLLALSFSLVFFLLWRERNSTLNGNGVISRITLPSVITPTFLRLNIGRYSCVLCLYRAIKYFRSYSNSFGGFFFFFKTVLKEGLKILSQCINVKIGNLYNNKEKKKIIDSGIRVFDNVNRI